MTSFSNPSFSNQSISRLSECHLDLQILFSEVIKKWDCTILEGYRDKERQDHAFEVGNSKKKFPFGKHNKHPSEAVDVAPCSVDWKDICKFHYFAGYVLGIAEILLSEGKISHVIRWGGDWDRDNEVKDETFRDLVHFEIVTTKRVRG